VRDFTLRGLEPASEEPLLSLEQAEVELKLVSMLRRKVDVASVSVSAPRVSLRRDADGRWNLPSPGQRGSSRSPFDRFIDLAVGRLRVSRGLVMYEDRRIPLDFEAEDVELAMDYERPGQAYSGEVALSRLHVTRPFASPLDFGASGSIRMSHDGLGFGPFELSLADSLIETSGAVRGWVSPQLEFSARGDVALADVVSALRLPLDPYGQVEFQGDWKVGADVAGQGTLTATGLSLSRGGIRVQPIAARANWSASRDGAQLSGLNLNFLGGAFRGNAVVNGWRDFETQGAVDGLSLARLFQLSNDDRELPWSGVVSGPVAVTGTFAALRTASMDLTIEDAEGGNPVNGHVSLSFDFERRVLAFQPSHVETSGSSLTWSGDAAERMEIQVASRDLDDLLPPIRFFARRDVAPLPVQLDQSQLRFNGSVTKLERLEGSLSTGAFRYQDLRFDGFEADVEATESGLRFEGFRLRQDRAVAEGSIALPIEDFRLNATGPLSGSISLTNAAIERMLRQAGRDLPISGTVQANLNLGGSPNAPTVSGQATLENGVAWGEPVERAHAVFQADQNRIMVESAEASSNNAQLQGSGSYGIRDGEARFRATAAGLRLRPWSAASQLPAGLDAEMRVSASGSATFSDQRATLNSLQGELEAPVVTLDGRPLGELRISTSTSGRLMTAQIAARLLGARVEGEAEWSLTPDAPGLGQIRVEGLSLGNLRAMGLYGDPNVPLPARGSADFELGFRGPVLRPADWAAAARVTRLEIEPAPVENIDVGRFAIRNSGPLVGTFDRRGFTIQSAHLVGDGTDLDVSGSLFFGAEVPWNLRVRGSFSLPGLSVIEPDLAATGDSTVDATVRGSLDDPDIVGTMELRNAAFRLRGIPNGLDRVNGSVRFDSDRATIQQLTASTGGGELSATGFVGFGGPQLVYRLQATADRVRVRYPEAVSTTFDANVTLSGTSQQSLLSGSVTVSRVGFRPQTDIGSLLAESARSAQATTPADSFVRGMQLDIRLVTSPDAELRTALTQNIQPEADLRIRGTAASPVALGRLAMNEGEINFFGSQYTITRGEVNFFNPSKLEPVLNFDLETTVRSIVVTINVTGPMGQLNLSYRSDPPLQPNEIIALLTVGRAPASTTTAFNTQSAQSFLPAGGDSLLGAAVSAPLTGRLQRFFGVSRLKIDPELNTLTNTPQARLTIEQQLSREITLTYVTNLDRTQNQVVRMQWDFSREFSVRAIRDENGLFGVDFLYRRRFK
jgi:translocation and assembly module TamB